MHISMGLRVVAVGSILLPLSALSVAQTQTRSSGGDVTELQEVVVTGSRIARPELEVPTPTMVVDSQLMEARGITNVVDILNEFPQIGNGFNNANTSFSFGDAGLSQLNLRNLGVNRTLTIINGRRRVGTPDDANFLAVDVGNIPVALIDRVEISTGGAAAVYGADAVAGVVNFILKDHFEGVKFETQYGRTQPNDYNDTLFSLTMGGNFDRGNAVMNVTHSENTRLLKRNRGRDVDYTEVSNPADTGPNDGIPSLIGLRNAESVFFGIPTITAVSPALGGTVIFDPAINNFRPFNASNSSRGIIDGSYSLGPDGGRGRYFDTAVEPVRRTSVYGSVRFDLTPQIKLINELMFSQSSSRDQIGPVFDVFSTTVSTDNPYMPASVRDTLLAGGETGITISRQHNEFGPRYSDLDRTFYSLLTGLEGKVLDRFDWSLTAEYGKTNTRNTQLNDRWDAHWFNAIDAINDPVTGQPECRNAAARAEGCVPVNVFGVGTISQAALDYVRINDHTTDVDTAQKLAQFNITGPIITLPAGPAKFDFGAEFREDTLDFRPSFVWQKALGFFASQFEPVQASNTVKEAFGELVVPVLKNMPFAKVLEVEGAYRYSNYERVGGVNTSKLGLTWAPVGDIRFRATQANTVRAPALAELFEPGSRGGVGLTDPCDPLQLNSGTANRRANCAALGLNPVSFDPITRRVTTLVLTTGNENLQVEKAKTLTAGVVLQPRWVPNLNISVDWYDINLRGAISQIGPQTTLNNCVDLPTLNNEFCGFVERGADGNIIQVKDSYVNANAIRVKGIDFDIHYSFRLSDVLRRESEWGSIATRIVGNHQINNAFIEKNIATGASTFFEHAGEYNNPAWRANLELAYKLGPLQANWYSRWVGWTVQNNQVKNWAEDAGPLDHVPSVIYHDASMSYELPFGSKVTLGVNNVFNRGPRDNPFTYAGTISLDDILGRFFFVRASTTFGTEK